MSFYVSMIRGKRVALLAGPFAAHQQAIDQINPARDLACEVDPWAHFDLFGTVKCEETRLGTLNRELGL